ncbi:MAG: hypothetical protein HY905_28245 [Deltaproteobacteria bacterium]|nr:hypothetical protein [Deltaproteobacteria bacterium]
MERVAAFREFLETYVMGLVDKGADEGAARADVNAIAHHFLYAINYELHGCKTFWVDESLAWMLGRTDLDIIGQCLRLPFLSCAFVFTDRATLELGESLLALNPSYRTGGTKLAILTAYLFGEEATEGEDRPVGVHLLFDPRSGERPYHVGRSLYVRPDDHLESILDSHHPDVAPRQLDAFLHAPGLKRLVHRAGVPAQAVGRRGRGRCVRSARGRLGIGRDEIQRPGRCGQGQPLWKIIRARCREGARAFQSRGKPTSTRRLPCWAPTSCARWFARCLLDSTNAPTTARSIC